MFVRQASPSAAPAAASKPVDPVVITAVITCGSVLVIVATVTIGYIVVRTGKSKDLGKKARDSVMVPRGNKVAPDGKARSSKIVNTCTHRHTGNICVWKRVVVYNIGIPRANEMWHFPTCISFIVFLAPYIVCCNTRSITTSVCQTRPYSVPGYIYAPFISKE